MTDFEQFLMDFLHAENRRLPNPDGRLLYRYECTDGEFWELVNLLRESEPPTGHDFDRYRDRWKEHRARHGNSEQFLGFPGLDWQIRAFVLYASEFWRRFRNDQWRQRTFPDGSPFKKLEWLHFLSLVGWEYLYRKRSAVKGYIEVAVEDRLYRIWHTNRVPANGDEQYPDSVPDKRGYPGLYFPMLAAWQWWNVAPLRLPTSIRYLDTFAHQGGAADQLVLECKLAGKTASKLIYEPVKPPDGYGVEALLLSRDALPPGADHRELNITLVFGAQM